MSLDFLDINDVYILDETGEEVNKVTGLYTKDENATATEQSQARANIMAGGSNRNLLDNPWWGSGEVVNQRGLTSGQTTVSYSIDRWKMTAGSAYGNWSLGANGITITAASGTYAVFQQLLEPRLYGYLAGKTVTCSALLSDGTVVSGTVQSVNWSSSTVVVTSGNIQLWLVSGGIFRVSINNGGSATIRAVKLEFGSVSTLANDAPPDYAEEILKCEYRCVVYDLPTNTLLCRGIATSTTNIAGVIDLPRDMAEDKTPTVSITGSLTTPAGNTITAIAGATYARKNKLRVNFTGTGFNSGTVYDIFTGSATPKITISADL